MALVEEMRNLAQDIVRSYEDRIKVIPQLKQAEAERQRAATQEISQRKSDVGATLQGFDDAHAAMSQELKAGLAKIAPALREAEAGRERVAAQEISQRKSDVGAMLQDFCRERAGGQKEWQKLTATMQAKRGGPAPERTAPSQGMAGLGDRAFQYLANRPDGVKMTELEQALGTPRIQMAKALKSLAEANKVRKQDLLYFAA